MNEEQNAKLNWIFDSMKFLLENTSTFDEDHKKKLLDEADRIELDFEVKETSLPSKTKDALSEDNKNIGATSSSEFVGCGRKYWQTNKLVICTKFNPCIDCKKERDVKRGNSE